MVSSANRISTLMRFLTQRNVVARNQSIFAQDSSRLNEQKRLLHNYDQINGAKDLVQINGKIVEYDNKAKNQNQAVTELELMESSLTTMKNMLDDIRTSALQGGSDTLNSENLIVLGKELREAGEAFYSASNAKVGNRYLFGGIQSDKQVVTYAPGSIFANATYKEGASDEGERRIENIQSSVGLGDIYTTQADSAKYTGSAISPIPLGANAELNLVVNDGYRDIVVGDIALASGDNLSTVVSKINAAFNAAGGQGSIVQASSGALNFDTNLITNNVRNSRAAIILNPGANLPNSLSTLGLSARSINGVSANIREAFTNLEAAYNSGDSQSIREALIDIEANIDRLIASQSKVGNLVKQFTDAARNNEDRKTTAEVQQSDMASLPAAEAIQKVTASQAALNGSMQAAATIMKTNVFDFLSL